VWLGSPPIPYNGRLHCPAFGPETPVIALALIVLLMLASWLLQALALKLGARWAKVPHVRFRRAVLTVLALTVVSAILVVVVNWFSTQVKLTLLVAALLAVVVVAVAESLLLAILLRTSVWRGALAWLVRQGATVALVLFIFLVVKPFVVEGFVQDSHGMAPTLLGTHVRGNCPHCGGSAAAPFDPRFPEDQGETEGICSSCQQLTKTMRGGEKVVVAGDRFAVCKFLSPCRWDVVTVYSPEPGRSLGTSRVVGLPGETVVIRDGVIWVNGAKQEQPADIAKLKYTTHGTSPDGFGSPDRPATLGPDEFFVMGDFPRRAPDSRIWGPVPRKDITGVVSLVYFPLNRVRLLK
jgi:signal peptidase I